MSVQAMARVLADSDAAGVSRLVLLVMANRAGGDHDECFASIDRLAGECRISVRSAQRAIKRIPAGDLELVGIHPKWRTNIWRVMPPGGVSECHPPGVSGPPAPPKLKKLNPPVSTNVETSPHTPPKAFEQFWGVFPRRVGKRTAAAAWERAARRASVLAILTGAARYRDDPNREPAFTKHPSTWLNSDGWEDDPLPARDATAADRDEERGRKLAEAHRLAAESRAG